MAHRCGSCLKKWECADIHEKMNFAPLAQDMVVEGFIWLPTCFLCMNHGKEAPIGSCFDEWRPDTVEYYQNQWVMLRKRALFRYMADHNVPLKDGRMVCGCNRCDLGEVEDD